jgi:hypothetical protein
MRRVRDRVKALAWISRLYTVGIMRIEKVEIRPPGARYTGYAPGIDETIERCWTTR